MVNLLVADDQQKMMIGLGLETNEHVEDDDDGSDPAFGFKNCPAQDEMK